jgi:hypothetical protein
VKMLRAHLLKHVDLDEETQKLLLFQIKHDIEYGYGGLFMTREWEKMRYENLKEFSRVTLQGNCIECYAHFPFLMDMFEFLALPDVFTADSNGKVIIQRIKCVKCGKPKSLRILPFWHVPRLDHKLIISQEDLT